MGMSNTTTKGFYSYGLGNSPERYVEDRFQDRNGALLNAESALHAEHGGLPKADEPTTTAHVTTCRCEALAPGVLLGDTFSAVELFERADERIAEDVAPWLDDEYFTPPGEAIAWLQQKVQNACNEAAMRFRLAPEYYNATDLEVHPVEVRDEDAIEKLHTEVGSAVAAVREVTEEAREVVGQARAALPSTGEGTPAEVVGGKDEEPVEAEAHTTGTP